MRRNHATPCITPFEEEKECFSELSAEELYDRVYSMLMSETDVGEDHARKMAGGVIMKTHRMELEHAPASLINELIKANLFEHGFERINEQSKKQNVPICDARSITL